jgi:hypothetical protein
MPSEECKDELAAAQAKLGVRPVGGVPLSRDVINENAKNWMYLSPFPERAIVEGVDLSLESEKATKPDDDEGDIDDTLRQSGKWVGAKLSGACSSWWQA